MKTGKQIQDAAFSILQGGIVKNVENLNAKIEGFAKGAEWMEEQLEPIITGLEMQIISNPKWISVKYQLPTEGNRYWVYIRELNDGGWFSHFQWNCYFDPIEKIFRDAGQTHTVTHWTNLLPPPEDDTI